ncbi:MAG TPA: hypothetical protein VHS96_06785 [Bacteroidia bacterium]|jgi:hypothetical protein|nr:hypothetical protein [Bacteroidia bacterium]
MMLVNDRSMDAKDDNPTKKISQLHKRLIEQKLREIKAIRIAFSR